MSHDILVITPSAAFGELLRQSLERNGDYGVQACQSANEALVLCRSTLFAVAILDGDLANQSLPQLGHEIRRRCPGVQLAVFPPDNNAKSPALAGGAFQAVLKKPFYLPTLLKTIKKLITEPVQANRPAQEAAAESGAKIPADKVMPGDTQKEGDCFAEAARNDGREGFAEAARNDGREGFAEAARNDGREGFAEAARNDGREGFAEAARNDGQDEVVEAACNDGQNEIELAVEGEENSTEAAWPEPILPPGALPPEMPEDEPPDAAPVIEQQELEKLGFEWIGPEFLEQPAPANPVGVLSPVQPAGEAAGEAPVPEQNRAATAADQADVDSHVKDTQPLCLKGMAVQAITCALTPLLAEHYLRSDQMNALRKAMLEISASQGWRIVWLSIRPSHVAWTVCLPAGMAPEAMLKVYRQASSEALFHSYPSFGYQNPSGDFWSPGSLLSPGERSLSRQCIYEFAASSHPSSLILHPF